MTARRLLVVCALSLSACERDHGKDTDTHRVLRQGRNQYLGHTLVSAGNCSYGRFLAEDGQTHEGRVVHLHPAMHNNVVPTRIVVGEGSRFELGDYAWRVTEVWRCNAVVEQIARLPRPAHEVIDLDTRNQENYLGDDSVQLWPATYPGFVDDAGKPAVQLVINAPTVGGADAHVVLHEGDRVDVYGTAWKADAVRTDGTATFERLSPLSTRAAAEK